MEPAPQPPPMPPRKSHVGAILGILVVITLVVVVFSYAITNPSFVSNIVNLGNPSSITGVSTILANNLSLCYPASGYSTYVSYALSVINTDRTHFHVSNVTLSPILSGQQHACSMWENGYFSHWDTNGYKPYMRYTILNGTGAMEENVAFESSTSPIPASMIENAISTLEYDMVYNDSGCCQNGHLFNIINPYHNRVSIGIMFGGNDFYFVEDFENYYIDLNTPILNTSNANVVLRGNATTSLNPDSVVVYYDLPPTPLNASILNSEYQTPYGEGSFVGGVIPPCTVLCTRFTGGITVQASTWQTGNTINVVFSLQPFISQKGSGVYTIYLTQNTFASNPNETESLTSISLFIST